MRTTTQILPGVKAIGWLDSRNLPRRVDLLGICLISIPILTDIHPIPFFGEPECKCQRKKSSTAGYEDTATLKFLTNEEHATRHNACLRRYRRERLLLLDWLTRSSTSHYRVRAAHWYALRRFRWLPLRGEARCFEVAYPL